MLGSAKAASAAAMTVSRSGASVRYRLYLAWGLSVIETTKVVIFTSLTLWIGFCTIGGIILLFEPMLDLKALHLPFASVHPFGIIFLMLVVGYFLWSTLRKKPIKIRGWEFSFPSTRIFLAQAAIASLDWAVAGSVLYILSHDEQLPAHLSGLGPKGRKAPVH